METLSVPAQSIKAQSIQAQSIRITPFSNQFDAKQGLNAAILESVKEVDLSTKKEPLSLLYKSAITNINEIISQSTGLENGIEEIVKQEIDTSPEATAERIASKIGDFFKAFMEKNPDIDSEMAFDSFMREVKKGIEQGFEEAREILEGLNVLNGDIESSINQTYDLLQMKLSDYEEITVEGFSTGKVIS